MRRRIPNRFVQFAFALAACLCAIASAHPSPGIVCTKDGTIYFVIGPTNELWKVTPEGKASVLVTGALDQDFRVPHHLYLDENENIITVSDAGSFIWRIKPDGTKEQIYPPVGANTFAPVGFGGEPFAITPDGDIIGVAEKTTELRIVRIDITSGKSTKLAGGEKGIRDGIKDAARFQSLGSAVFAWVPDNALYFADNRTTIRRLTMDGDVTTVFDARKSPIHNSANDNKTIQSIVGIVVTKDGTIYAADPEGRRIWAIKTNGEHEAITGNGRSGKDDGNALDATFEEPMGIAIDHKGAIIVLEQIWDGERFGARIRRIQDGQVSTVADVKSSVVVQ